MAEYNGANNFEDEIIADLQDHEKVEIIEKANNIVLGFVATTSTTGFVPIPFADAPLIIVQQVAMMTAINVVFQMDVSKDVLKSLATAAIGVAGSTLIGKTVVANVLKIIPGIGPVVGGATSAATAGLITLVLGKSYIEVCRAINMGILNPDDLARKAGEDALKAAFKEQLKQNKK